MVKIILFFLRKRLGVKAYEGFRFANQKKDAVYYFTSQGLMKMTKYGIRPSNVSLNWLLNEDCKIVKV